MSKPKVIKQFLFKEKHLQAGEDFPGSPAEAERFRSLGFVELYETKGAKKKPKAASGSSPASEAAQASRKKTAKKRTKKATK